MSKHLKYILLVCLIVNPWLTVSAFNIPYTSQDLESKSPNINISYCVSVPTFSRTSSPDKSYIPKMGATLDYDIWSSLYSSSGVLTPFTAGHMSVDTSPLSSSLDTHSSSEVVGIENSIGYDSLIPAMGYSTIVNYQNVGLFEGYFSRTTGERLLNGSLSYRPAFEDTSFYRSDYREGSDTYIDDSLTHYDSVMRCFVTNQQDISSFDIPEDSFYNVVPNVSENPEYYDYSYSLPQVSGYYIYDNNETVLDANDDTISPMPNKNSYLEVNSSTDTTLNNNSYCENNSVCNLTAVLGKYETHGHLYFRIKDETGNTVYFNEVKNGYIEFEEQITPYITGIDTGFYKINTIWLSPEYDSWDEYINLYADPFGYSNRGLFEISDDSYFYFLNRTTDDLSDSQIDTYFRYFVPPDGTYFLGDSDMDGITPEEWASSPSNPVNSENPVEEGNEEDGDEFSPVADGEEGYIFFAVDNLSPDIDEEVTFQYKVILPESFDQDTCRLDFGSPYTSSYTTIDCSDSNTHTVTYSYSSAGIYKPLLYFESADESFQKVYYLGGAQTATGALELTVNSDVFPTYSLSDGKGIFGWDFDVTLPPETPAFFNWVWEGFTIIGTGVRIGIEPLIQFIWYAISWFYDLFIDQIPFLRDVDDIVANPSQTLAFPAIAGLDFGTIPSSFTDIQYRNSSDPFAVMMGWVVRVCCLFWTVSFFFGFMFGGDSASDLVVDGQPMSRAKKYNFKASKK